MDILTALLSMKDGAEESCSEQTVYGNLPHYEARLKTVALIQKIRDEQHYEELARLISLCSQPGDNDYWLVEQWKQRQGRG